ncbi:MAG: DUF2442 domain-containing protein [Terracidiphilus sp.]
MPDIARVVTTDAEIDSAIEHARRHEKQDRRVIRASYSGGTDSIILLLENGVTLSIPRRLLQGLADTNPSVLNNIELLGRGTGLYWPALDVAHRVSGLLAGVYGSAKWMKHLQLESEASRIFA